jgi:hypothetical protein
VIEHHLVYKYYETVEAARMKYAEEHSSTKRNTNHQTPKKNMGGTTGSGAHPASYSMGTEDPLPWEIAAGA